MVRDPTPLRFLTLVVHMRTESPPRFDMEEWEKGRNGELIGCERALAMWQMAEGSPYRLKIYNIYGHAGAN